jgi:hypothetical protein
VATEDMPPTAHYVGSWPGHPTVQFIDVSDSETRHAFQSRVRQLWERVPAPVRFVDNAAIHRSAGQGQPWAAYCKNIQELRSIGESRGSKLIFNVTLHIGMLSDSEAELLIQAVKGGGIALEMPWHRNIGRDKAATQDAMRRYRQFLDRGIAVVLIPADTSEDQLASWVRTWRKPQDHLYMSGSFWKAPETNIYNNH